MDRDPTQKEMLREARQLHQSLAPLSAILGQVDKTNPASPIDTLIQTQRQILKGLAVLRGEIESLHKRLDDIAGNPRRRF